MKRLIPLILLSILLVFFLSCKKENPEQDNISKGMNYFPLEQGKYIIYEITEITIDKPSEYYDTVIYYIKELTESIYIDNQSEQAYRIERYIRYNETDEWNIHQVWSSKLTNISAQKVEENQRFVKIRFPVKIGLSWNGNIYNDLDLKKYEITDIHYSENINGFNFDSCLLVIQKNSESLIHKDLELEIYAWNIGMIYKEITNINSQEVIFDIPIEARITTGNIYTQKIIDFN